MTAVYNTIQNSGIIQKAWRPDMFLRTIIYLTFVYIDVACSP